jgi:hypothetical membrane protein
MKWHCLVAILSFIFAFSSFSCTHYDIPCKKVQKAKQMIVFTNHFSCFVIVTINKGCFSDEIFIVALLIHLHT